jgi:putative ABC transport system permease protein
VLRGAVVQLTVGLALGIGGAIGVARLLQSVVVQSGTPDSATVAAIAALLAAVSLAACFLSARRATRLDPVNALRYE